MEKFEWHALAAVEAEGTKPWAVVRTGYVLTRELELKLTCFVLATFDSKSKAREFLKRLEQ